MLLNDFNIESALNYFNIESALKRYHRILALLPATLRVFLLKFAACCFAQCPDDSTELHLLLLLR